MSCRNSAAADDIKDPSAEASALGGRFYSKVWMKGGREIADEAIKKNEKESHDAQEEAKRAKEAAERVRLIGTFIEVQLRNPFTASELTNIFNDAAEHSPPPEPYNPEADSALKEALETIKIANEAVGEAVNRTAN